MYPCDLEMALLSLMMRSCPGALGNCVLKGSWDRLTSHCNQSSSFCQPFENLQGSILNKSALPTMPCSGVSRAGPLERSDLLRFYALMACLLNRSTSLICNEVNISQICLLWQHWAYEKRTEKQQGQVVFIMCKCWQNLDGFVTVCCEE